MGQLSGMEAMLRARFPGAETAPAPQQQTASRRAFVVLFCAGGLFGLAHLAIPGADVARPDLMGAAAATAFLLAAAVGLIRRWPAWGYQLALAIAALATAGMVHATGAATSVLTVGFFWIAAYAFYWFTESEAAELAVILAVSVFLTILGSPDALGTMAGLNWLGMSVFLCVTGALAGRLGRERVTRLSDQVEQAARTDALTGLLNRRGFQEALRAEFDRAHRTNRSFSVVVADLDGFKRVNEGLGWHAGDVAMEYVSAILRRSKRRIDLAARLGEDEFALLLPESSEHAAYMVAERIRHELKTAFAAEAVPITISFGIANWPLHHSTVRGLFTGAQQALLLAKELGGDSSAMYGENILTRLATASARNDQDSHLSTLLSLAEAVDIRDGGTAAHCQNVGRYAAALGRELGMPDDVVERLRTAGMLHDLGKIGVSDSVLRKPGPLSESEWEEMRRHPELGAHILDGPELTDLRAWVLGHHERFDGRGYPYGLGPDEVPMEAKILAVADAFEAMTADRVYRSAMPVEEACARLRAGAGTQWDPRVVDAMLRLVEKRELLVSNSIWVSQEAGMPKLSADQLRRSMTAIMDTPPLPVRNPVRRTIAVRGTLAGRQVNAIWSDGRVSGDPLMVTMVEQLRAGHEVDLQDPWNFLLLVGSAFDQGTLVAEGDLPDPSVIAATPA